MSTESDSDTINDTTYQGVWVCHFVSSISAPSRLVSRCNQQHVLHTREVSGHLGSERHSFPRAIAAFFCTAVLLASAAAWRKRSCTTSVPSRLLASPSISRQWAKHRAAFPDTISSQPEASKWRKTDSSAMNNDWKAKTLNVNFAVCYTHMKIYRLTAITKVAYTVH